MSGSGYQIGIPTTATGRADYSANRELYELRATSLLTLSASKLLATRIRETGLTHIHTYHVNAVNDNN